jgi:polyisoprenoid-binding protein YceI
VRRAAVALALLALACAGSPTLEKVGSLSGGTWTVVDADSDVYFVGIKNNAVGVTGVFSTVSGTFDSRTGNAVVEVAIASLFTNDAPRDANIRTHFFEESKFPRARFTVAKLPQLELLPPEGETRDYELSGTLELHGAKLPLALPVRVTRENGARLRVRNRKPIVLTAKDLGMETQLAVLKAVCGHESLSGAVPVDVDVVFAPAAPR